MNTDSDIRDVRVEYGDYVDAVDMRNSRGEIQGGPCPAKGNVFVEYPPELILDERLLCIGAVEDELGGSVVGFIYNFDNHFIARYFPDQPSVDYPNGLVVNVINNENLFFTPDHLISGAKIVDGRFLFFTDGKTSADGKTISGRGPKCIDMDMSTIHGKFITYELYWQENSFETGNEFYLNTIDIFGADIIASTLIYTSLGASIPDEVAALAVELGAYDYTITVCDNKIILESLDPEVRTFITSPLTHLVSINHYPDVEERMLEIKRPAPVCGPDPLFLNDVDVVETKVWGEAFQFRYRYHYYDGVKSAWSPLSYVPTNFLVGGDSFMENYVGYNRIRLDLDDELLDTAEWKTFIRKVEIAVRYSENDVFKTVEYVDVADMGINAHSYLFKNDSAMTAVASDESGGSVDAQVLKNFDHVPTVANAVNTIVDEEGNYRLSIGGMEEDFDLPKCIESLLEFDFEFETITFPDNQYSFRKQFKSGGVYSVGIIGETSRDRQTSVIKLGRIRFPWLFDFPTGGTIEVDKLIVNVNTEELLSPLEKFRIVMTKNQNQSTYLQAPAFDIQYWKVNDDSDFIAATAVDAEYVAFVFPIPEDPSESGNVIFDSKIYTSSFLAEQGDRIQLLYAFNASGLVASDFNELNYEIVGYNLTYPSGTFVPPGRYSVFVKYDPAMPDFTLDYTGSGVPPLLATDYGYVLCELYRPHTVFDEIYYEIETCPHDIVGGMQTYEVVHRGDAYSVGQLFRRYYGPGAGSADYDPKVVMFPYERPSLYRFNTDRGGDWGRAHVIDPDFRQVYNYHKIRVSDLYAPQTLQNGLHSFRGLEHITVDRQHGPIQRLETAGGTMLAVCRNRCQPIYVRTSELLTLSGGFLKTFSDKLLTVGQPLKEHWGTQNPESVVNYDGYIFGWDKRTGHWWRYATDGLNSISGKKNKRRFNDIASLKRQEDGEKAIGAIQRQYDLVYLDFFNPDDELYLNNFSHAVKENKIVSRHNFIPEMMGWTGNYLVSFKNGLLYLHETTPYCNYYGDQYSPSLTIPVNPMSSVKHYFSMRTHTRDVWEVYVEVLPNEQHFVGQLSEIPVGRWKNNEGIWVANFLRDMNDQAPEFTALVGQARAVAALLRGRKIRGEAALITLTKYDPTTTDCINRVEFYLDKSYNS